MKVTVCFGSVRVVVPCGNGELLIGDVIDKAVTRYKKATGKACWVSVHTVKSVGDGGILDPDDRLRDVADDREQIVAIFEEQPGGAAVPAHLVHNGGDGSSDTPEVDDSGDSSGGVIEVRGGGSSAAARRRGGALQVRRGSEPALNRLVAPPYVGPMKRWSTAVVLDDDDFRKLPSPQLGAKGHVSDGDFLSDREDGSGEERSATNLSALARSEPLGGSGDPPLGGAALNTRRLGRRLAIELVKGPEGLGFSVTTRDNFAGLVYVKKILGRGAAVADGRLRPGDRLLEVDGVAMSGKTQDDAVRLLRDAPLGAAVSLVVSRQVEPPPRRRRRRHVLSLDIPLNDTGSAGLGVSVKGKTSTGPAAHLATDLGIFVKSVIHGGAASKDGRLRDNDQLVSVNGVSLLGMPNSVAMETLRRVMHLEGPRPGAITLSVARRLKPEVAPESLPPPASDASSSSSSESPGPGPQRHLVEDKDLGLDCPVAEPNPVVERITGRATAAPYYQACRSDPWGANDDGSVLIEDEFPAPPHLMRHQAAADFRASLDGANFDRDGFGRQSMSEKRNAQLDARSTDTWQRNKAVRDARRQGSPPPPDLLRCNSADSLAVSSATCGGRQLPAAPPLPPLNRSNSLESVPCGGATDDDDDDIYGGAAAAGSRGGSRNRGCNESFRAAVDRSYDAATVAPPADAMETLDEESECAALPVGALSSPGGAAGKGKGKKRSGLLRNLFRFGKANKKCPDVAPPGGRFEYVESDFYRSDAAARRPSERDFERARELRRSEGRANLAELPVEAWRCDRMQELRAQHQRWHCERRGLYPLDDREEILQAKVMDKVNEQYVVDGSATSGGETKQIVHGRSHSYDLCLQPDAARGRMAIYSSTTTGGATASKYGHYVNYEEIQQHLGQQQQRHQALQQRPLASTANRNYYERGATVAPPFAHSNHGSLRGFPLGGAANAVNRKCAVYPLDINRKNVPGSKV